MPLYGHPSGEMNTLHIKGVSELLGYPQMSTGHLHLDGFESATHINKIRTPHGGVLILLVPATGLEPVRF